MDNKETASKFKAKLHEINELNFVRLAGGRHWCDGGCFELAILERQAIGMALYKLDSDVDTQEAEDEFNSDMGQIWEAVKNGKEEKCEHLKHIFEE